MTRDDRLDERIDSGLAALSRDVVPARDLWPQVLARIEADSIATIDSRRSAARWWQSPWTQLAAACVLVVVTATVTYQLVRPTPGGGVPTGAPMASLDAPMIRTLPATPASFGQEAVLGADYTEARAVLTKTFELRLAELPPATRQKVEGNLADIRRASAELAAALDEHPANPLLQDLLVSTYQEELALFSQINQVTAPTSMRNDL